MALMLAVLGMVLGLVMASSLLLRWNEVQYSRRRGLPPGTMGWPLFGENTEFLKQGPSFMRARRLRLVGFSWLTRTTWHFPSACLFLPRFSKEKQCLCFPLLKHHLISLIIILLLLNK
jgi:hypothetical protein